MLSLNGQNCFDDGLRVEAIARADLNGIVPKVGFVGGGQQVRVWASGLHRRSAELGYTHCRFGDSSVPATMESEETLVCTTPAHPSGIFTLEVTQNDQQQSASFLTFEYEDAGSLSMEPRSGPVRGGTKVIVRGASLHDGRGSADYHDSCVFKGEGPKLKQRPPRKK